MTNYEVIKAALAPTFEALRSACLIQLQNQAAGFEAALKDNDWNIEAAFPFPNGTMSHEDYRSGKARRELAGRLTVADGTRNGDGCRGPRCPYYVAMKPSLSANLEKQAADYARSFIDAYCVKLAGKVEAEAADFVISKADYSGTLDPFSRSFLVLEGNGPTLRWSTTCIVNCSKYGKLFNQWPTRKA